MAFSTYSLKTKPPILWGFCNVCGIQTRWTLGTHHSGERMYQCSKCLKNWCTKPTQKSAS